MKKVQLIVFWVVFFFASFYSLVKIDQWYVFTKVPVSLPMATYFLSMWDEGYISIDGTIRGKNDDLYDDLNTIKVECIFSEKQCNHYIAGLFNPKNSDGYQPLLNVKAQRYQVVTWNKEFLIYKEIGQCFVSTFTLMRDTKTLTGITKYSKNKNFCQRDDEVSFSIISGFDFVQSENRRVQNTLVNILAAIAVFSISAYGIFRAFRPRK